MKNNNLNAEVSISLCTYNGEKFLASQLESIINQDYKYITEIVCVDDCSTDKTWEILTEYSKKYNNLKIFKNKENLGFIRNFEKALTLTTKPFIAISDQDDIWYPTKISKLIQGIGTNLMIYSDNEFIDKQGFTLGKRSSHFRNITTCSSCLSFSFFNVISGHTILLSRELLKYCIPFHREIPHDLWIAFKASQYGEIQVIDEHLVGYRQHDNNVFGVKGQLGVKGEKTKRINLSQRRVQIFAENTASHLENEKKIFEQLADSYTDKSIKMRLRRVKIFWKNRDSLLLFRDRTKIQKMIYCISAFWKYQ